MENNIVEIYKQRGYQIGNNCVIEAGSVIEGKSVLIGDDVHIGRNCVIRGEEIIIGDNCLFYDDVFIHTVKHIQFGNRCKVSRQCTFRGNRMIFGNELWCNEFVDIGGGGCWSEKAFLEVGDFVHIGKSVMINVCCHVHIGDMTGIGIESMIFTHSAGNGQSILEGYKHIEENVWIGNHVSLFTRAFVAPGTVIEDGATIGAMAYVRGVAKKGLHLGIPAKLKKEYEEISDEEQNKILKDEILNAFGSKVEIHDKKLVVSGENRCVFDIEKGYINGTATELSEKLRDFLRRNGILLKFQNYTPYKLDYEELRKRGVER